MSLPTGITKAEPKTKAPRKKTAAAPAKPKRIKRNETIDINHVGVDASTLKLTRKRVPNPNRPYSDLYRCSIDIFTNLRAWEAACERRGGKPGLGCDCTETEEA